MSSNTGNFIIELLGKEVNTKQIRCRKFKLTYPSITPVIYSLNPTSSTHGIYTQVLISGLNFYPFDKTVLNFGPYKNIPISYLSSFNISFVVPNDALPGNYDVQLANISTTQVTPTYFYSNIINFTIL